MYQSEQLRIDIAGDDHKQPSPLHELPEAFAAYPAADVSIGSIGELARRDLEALLRAPSGAKL